MTGYFDPLTAAHAIRLSELRGDSEQLIVAIDDPPDPLLPTRARAELVASLEAVDYVMVSVPDALQTLGADEIIHEEAGDLARRRVLSDHVMSRQNAKT